MTVLLFTIILTLSATTCSYNGVQKYNASVKKESIEIKQVNPAASEPIPGGLSASNSQSHINIKAGEASKSGPIASFPWENDSDFIKQQQKNGLYVLMGGYQTVLKDPLPGEEYNVHLAARLLAGKIVNPGQVFSQNAAAGPYTVDRGFRKGPTYMGVKLVTTIGGGVCKIASTLYNVAILSNLQIVERHAHSMPVPYVPYGQDATVSYGNKDIKFKNNTSFPVMIWAVGIENILYIGFYGKEKPPKVEWHHETLNVVKAPVIYEKNPELPKGTEKVKLEGMDGMTVKSHITIENPAGTPLVRNLGVSYYKPMPYIIEVNK